MTKAEAWVYARTLRSTNLSDPFWLRMDRIEQDHKNTARCSAVVYHRRTFVDGNPVDTHRLVCYFTYGDSILWEAPSNEDPWTLYNCRYLPYGANSEGNIEFAYDHVLPLIHPDNMEAKVK